MFNTRFRIAIIGMGPRGLSALERFCANISEMAPNREIEIHVVDPFPPGAGNVWRTNQSRNLLMNTVASQITLFTDPSVTCEGPQAPGPSLYEWAYYLTLMGSDEHDEWVLEEAHRLKPDSYPTRAFYGNYLKWVFQRVIHNMPDSASIHSYESRAISLDDAPDGRQVIQLEDGDEPLIVDAVIMALGHTPVSLTKDEQHAQQFAKENGLCYITPSNPADVDLSMIGGGEPVILRGLGLNFFDYMAELSFGRGGKFVRQEDGRLVYEASGNEPKMYAGSRRGIPYHARGDNEKGAYGRHYPIYITNKMIEEFRDRANNGEPASFRDEIWPLVAKEIETVYYTALIKQQSCVCDADKFLASYRELAWGSDAEQRLLDAFKVAADQRWSWERLARPYGDRVFASQGEFRAWMLDYLRNDLNEAKLGNVSGPLKAALDLMRDLRNELRLIVDHAGIRGDSFSDDLEHWYTPLNAFLSIGPPAQRIEQMIALIEAGVLEILGPNMHLDLLTEPARFRTASTMTGEMFEAKAMIEARLPEIDLRRTTDPLLAYLLKTGQCRAYTIDNGDGTAYETGGLAVTSLPYRLLDANDAAHPRRFAYGVPTEGVHWVTAAGIRPGVNSVTLGDSDAIARASLSLATETADHLAAVAGDKW